MNTCTTDRPHVECDADSAVSRTAARAMHEAAVGVQPPALWTRTADARGNQTTHDRCLSPEGRFAIVVAEPRQRLDVYDPRMWQQTHAVPVWTEAGLDRRERGLTHAGSH
jgi:hypothetical protein